MPSLADDVLHKRADLCGHDLLNQNRIPVDGGVPYDDDVDGVADVLMPDVVSNM